MTKALEHLFIKSTDAVQQYINANEFRKLPSVADDDDDDDDDEASSVSSYADEPDKDRLADSSLSLESELESAYESLSEDGDGNVGHARPRTGGRPRSFDVRTVRRDSRSRSRSRDRTAAYRKASAPPAPFPVHRSRVVDPPRPYACPPRVSDSGNMRFPALSLQMPLMPPIPGQGSMATCANASGSSDSRPGDDRMHGASMAYQQQRLKLIQKQREEVQRVFQDGQRMGLIDQDGQPTLPPGAMLPPRSGPPSQPASWPPLYTAIDRHCMAPPITTRSQPTPPQQPLPSNRSPVKNTHQSGKTSPPPMMHPSASTSSLTSSVVSSSASSTATVTVSPNTPPEYSSAWAPASIDYRLVIKTPFPHTLGLVSEHQENRIIARTPPTRKDMSVVALRYVHQNLPHVKSGAKGPLRATVTRAVFNAGQGREESYDLAAYPEADFSNLCEIMKRSGDGEDRVGLPFVSGWPLFEVVVSMMD